MEYSAILRAVWESQTIARPGCEGELCNHHAGDKTGLPAAAACRCYAIPHSCEDLLGTSTILPVTPPFPSTSCACLASERGKRCAMSGLIFCC